MSDQIHAYLKHVIKANSKLNLTRIIDESDAELLHIEDSLAALPEMNMAPEGIYADIGSGGGFPGVPLGIKTGRKTVLIDSVQKKMKAVQDILESLGLDDQITTDGRRIEEVSLDHREAFSVVTARALAKLPVLLELASPLLMKGGILICLKANISDEEIVSAVSIEEQTGLRLINRRSFFLSDKTTHREIIMFEKVTEPSMYLPRRVGMAQKRPLH